MVRHWILNRKWLALTILGMLLPGPALADDNWQFRLTPYVWFAGIKGDVGTIPPLPTVPIDVSPSDAVKDTEGGFMFMLDAKKQGQGFTLDFLYTDVQSDTTLVPAPINLNMKSTSKTTIATLAYQHELYNRDGIVVDGLVGLRYWETDSELQFSGGLGLLAGRSISNTESWVDPGVGIKGRTQFGKSRFYLEGGAGIGGFGVGSDLFYDLNVAVGYQWNKSIGTVIGYRMFDVDYENNGYVYDVRQQGWELGITFAF